MNAVDEKFNFNYAAIQYERDHLIKKTLEIFDYISKNQESVIKALENNIKQLKKEEDEKLQKIKAEKISENKQLETDIFELENKISSKFI